MHVPDYPHRTGRQTATAARAEDAPAVARDVLTAWLNAHRPRRYHITGAPAPTADSVLLCFCAGR